MRKVLFVDRGGTLIEPFAANPPKPLEQLRLVPGVIPALSKIRSAGYEIVIVTNQGGLGADAFSPAAMEFLLALFASQGVPFAAHFVCPHRPDEHCACRKPGIGLVRDFVNAAPLDRERSAMVGDNDSDVEFARNLDIRVIVDLDLEAEPRAHTGLGFFDHMLEQLGKHGGFKLDVRCGGDLHIDEHHTVEDVALAIGQALKQALGDKRGIQRYGFLLPMDEADVEVSVDLGGRPYLVFDGAFPRERVGELPTELVPHFFRSLAETLGAAIHVRVRGENAHHMVEVCFKGVARALRMAIERRGNVLPTTKGQL